MDEFSTIIIEFSNRITAPKSPCYYPFIFLKKYAKMSLLNRKDAVGRNAFCKTRR